jgi:hypothetical protein
VAPCPVSPPIVITNPSASLIAVASQVLPVRHSSAPPMTSNGGDAEHGTITAVTPTRSLTAGNRSSKRTSGECTPTEIQLSVHTLTNTSDA